LSRRTPGMHREGIVARAKPNELYEVLGVSNKASVTEIKRAYYKEAKDAHPDKHPGDEKMYARFQKVAEAYQTLADPVRREQYDLSGLAGLGSMNINATRLFGPPPWRVLIGKTDHWLWSPRQKDAFLGLMAASIPNGIAGVTINTIEAAYKEAFDTNIAILLDRVSEEQAKDTAEAIEEYGLAVKAEPIEAERSNEEEPPLIYFRRMQRELGDAAEELRRAAEDPDDADEGESSELLKYVNLVKELRSELRAARAAYEASKEEKEAAKQKELQRQEEERKKAEEAEEDDGKGGDDIDEEVEKSQELYV